MVFKFMVAMLTCMTAFAQPLSVKPEQTAKVGKIFLSPQQRLQIDQALAFRNPSAETDKSNSVNSIHGVVRRSDGHTVIWVNGKMQPHAN
jgi:hypothetical protein